MNRSALALGALSPAFLLAASLLAQPLTLSPLAGQTNGGGYEDGPAALARFSEPSGLAVDADGTLYVADSANHAIRRVATDGTVVTAFGLLGAAGSFDGPRGAARFDLPRALAFAPSGAGIKPQAGTGAIWVAEANHVIRKIDEAGNVTTLAGLAGITGFSDGTGAQARFNEPGGILVDAQGTVYIADTRNHTIRKILPTGRVVTLAGVPGKVGYGDGQGPTALFSTIRYLAFDPQGNILVADSGNQVIRRVTTTGSVTTVAGRPDVAGADDGPAKQATFNFPRGVASDPFGNIYVADTNNRLIRKIDNLGNVTTVAGSLNDPGSTDGSRSAVRFYAPEAIVFDPGTGTFLVSDVGNNVIRRVTANGVVTTFAGRNDLGTTDAAGAAARFDHPQGIATDAAGNVYVADSFNFTLRKAAPDGTVTTIAGSPKVPGATDAIGTAARFAYLSGGAVDAAGNLWITDYNNQTVRRMNLASGQVTTVAGKLQATGSADGAGSVARFNYPFAVAVDRTSGFVYVSDSENNTIRRITPAGVVSTLAGSPGESGSDDGTGSSARFSKPCGLAVDATGNVLVADTGNDTVRKVTPSGVVTTLAGKGPIAGHVDGLGADARFDTPVSLAIDAAGDLYVGESSSVVRRVTSKGAVTTVAGRFRAPGGQPGTGGNARLGSVEGLAADASGRLLLADWQTHRLFTLTAPLDAAATVDARAAAVGAARHLDCPAPGATSWQWKVLQQPLGSSAALSSSTARSPTFTPDVASAAYLLQCQAVGPSGSAFANVPLFATPAPAVAAGTVPIVLDVVGKGGARFASQLALANSGTAPASVTLTYVAATSLSGAGSGSVGESLAPGRQLLIPDALSYLRNKGLAIPDVTTGSQGGTVRVEMSGVSALERTFAGARTTAPSGAGRAGLSYAAVAARRPFTTGVWLFGLRENSADRSNLALVNAGTAGPITLRIALFSGLPAATRFPDPLDGVPQIPDVTLAPGQWTQLNSVLAQVGLTNGYALVERIAGSDPFYAYAVFNDNATNDGSFVVPVRTDEPAGHQVIPVLVETGTFESELILTNPGADVLTATLTYVESLAPGAVPPVPVSETLQPGEQKIISKAIAYLRGKGASIGPAGGGKSYAGAMGVDFKDVDGLPARGFAGVRTGAPAVGGGQYGLFYPAAGLEAAAETEAFVYGLEQTAASRSNLALVNMGTLGAITLRYEVYDGATGAKAFTSDPVALTAGAWTQVNRVLEQASPPLANGYVRIVKASGSEPFLAYGVVNDGRDSSQGTNDGSYVAMSVAE